jgi:CHASE2 domain-containing sensor protein
MAEAGAAVVRPDFDPLAQAATALSSIVVAIDEPSFAEFGQWPWRRDIHARLIEQLRAAGAKGIVLDLVSRSPAPIRMPMRHWRG